MTLQTTSRRIAALLAATTLAAPTALRAQQTTYVGAFVYDAAAGTNDEHALLGAASLSTQSALAGASAWSSLDAFGGAAHLFVGTSSDAQSGTATAAFGYDVTLTNTGGPATVAPMQLFLDGVFRRTSGATGGTAYANVIGRAWDVNAGTLVSSVDLWLFADDDATGVQRAWDALLLPRPATVGGATTFRIDWAYAVAADGGWEADFRNTARIYFPTVNGIAWSADGGVLTQQARPSWAQDQVVDDEIGITATPEPATIVLLGGGLLGLAVAARRQRAA
jgi:hypothetical protein